MKVLIGITSKNREAILPKAITSGLTQSYPEKEVAVYDDASTDGTAKLAPQFPCVKWVLSDIPHGYVYARNMFLTLVPNDIFCSLDDDSWFLTDAELAVAVNYMKEHQDVGAIAFDILSPDDGNKQRLSTVTPVETNMYIGCGHLLRTDVVKKLGGYIPNPGYYGGEEKDLCIRLIDEGYRIIKMQGLYVWHDKTSVARNQPKQHRSGVCNDLVFTYRRVPGWMLIPVLGYKLFSHLRFSVFYKQAPLVAPCLQGFGDFFRFLFRGNKQRRAVTYNTYRKFRSLN